MDEEEGFYRFADESLATIAGPSMSDLNEAISWNNLPAELIDNVFAHLPIESIVSSKLVCADWNAKIKSKEFLKYYASRPVPEMPWLIMCSSFNCRQNTCAYNPTSNTWHNFSLGFLPEYMRFPLGAVAGLVLVGGGNTNVGIIGICNPISQTWRELPSMVHKRLNSVVGAFEDHKTSTFRIIVAGGTSEHGDYVCTTEMYDSATNSWSLIGTIPRDYSIKITVWASKTIFCDHILYCLTSARPYNLMAYDMEERIWWEVRIPQPESLFCSFLLQRKGKLYLVGSIGDRICSSVSIWEFDKDGQAWIERYKMPEEFLHGFLGGKGDVDMRCCGVGDLVYFFKNSQSSILVCDISKTPASWKWLPPCPLQLRSMRFLIRGWRSYMEEFLGTNLERGNRQQQIGNRMSMQARTNCYAISYSESLNCNL